MKKLVIETITKPMKLKGISQGLARLDGKSLEADLDNLTIRIGSETFKLDKIPGTKGGYRYFFYALIVVGGVGYFMKKLCLGLRIMPGGTQIHTKP